METMKNKCSAIESKLADLLLDPTAVPAKVQAHVAECDSCREQLAELRATMALMDTWEAPEPSPYFLSRLDARMREERATPPASWLERMRARFTYGPSMHVRPLAAMALTVVLLLGGGTYLGITDWDQPSAPPGQAAVVHDLQTLDNNAQLLDQLEAMSSTNENGD
jgi:predicted anti-sigma-YlaC factor YlaD